MSATVRKTMPKIIVVGSANVDLNVRASRLPCAGETLTGTGFDRAMGGKGANQAVGAARLGGRTTFLCAVGDDPFASECLAAYERDGIDLSLALRREGVATGVALITVAADGANTIVLAPGANATLRPGDLDPLERVLEPGDLLLLQLEIPFETVERAVDLGAERGARVVLDPAPALPDGLPQALYPKLFALLPNESEAMALCPDAPDTTDLEAVARRLQGWGVEHAIVTCGTDGIIWAAAGGVRSFPAHKTQAVDTVAAGDAFAGGFAVALAEGKEVPEAIAFGQRAAAVSVGHRGAQPSLPTRAEVDAFSVV